MINITFRPDTRELEMEGHAKHGVKGKDIVCSAVSCLFYTLGESLTRSISMLTEPVVFREKDGHGYIRSYPKEEYEGNIEMIYWTILIGLQMLADQYPNNISFNVKIEG